MVGAVVVLEWRCFGRGVSNQARGKNLINCASAVILSLSLSLSFPPSVNRTGLIFAMKIVPLVGKQCATPSRDSRENIFWSIGVSRNREPIKSNSGTKRFWGEGGGKTKRGWKGRRRGRKKRGRERGKKRGKNMRHDFLEAVKNTCLHGEPRLGPRSDGYTGLICMRPLPPGVPEFAYERVALADFSLLLVPFSLSLSLLFPRLCIPFCLVSLLSSAFVHSGLCSTPGVRIYGLLAQRVASLTRR